MGRIFLSYHGHDEGDVIALYLRDALTSAGYQDVHAYTAPGAGPEVSAPWRESLRRHLLGAEALIVITTPGSSSDWCVWESSVFREAKPDAPCIEFFSGVTHGRAILDNLQAQHVIVSSPESLASARDTTLRILADHKVDTAPMDDSPFPGLRAFDEQQASIFFGRADDVERLAAPMLGSRTSGAMAVIGPSGAGKSSLVRAGLIPRLRREGWKITGPVTPSRGAHDALTSEAGTSRRVIVLDQAEELLSGASEGVLMPSSLAVVQALVEASRGEAWVVYTVRADFLDALMQHEQFAPLLRDDFLVRPLTRADLPVVVNGPLRARGWRVDEAALGSIQEDATGESLPLLAFALERLWRHVNPNGLVAPRAITRAEYMASGRVADVLRTQAEDAFATARDLMRDDDGSWLHPREAERRVLGTLRRLVSVDRSGKFTKRAVPLADMSAHERLVLEPFLNNRVLTTTTLGSTEEDIWTRHAQSAVEVAHESLFLHWPRLRENLEHDHAALRARREIEAIAAESEHHPDQLIAPSRLNSLINVLLPPAENMPFTGTWKKFEDAMISAHLSARASRLLASSLQQKVDEEAKRALLLGPEDALREMVGDDLALRLLHAPDLSKWRQSLLWTMSSTHLLHSIPGHNSGISSVDWSHDDTRLVTGSFDGTVRVWNADTGECLQVLAHDNQLCPVQAVAWSPTGEIIASVATDDVLRLWSVRESREVLTKQLPFGALAVRFDAEGECVLVGCKVGVVVAMDLRGGGLTQIGGYQPTSTTGQAVQLCDVDISSDGTWTAVAKSDGDVDIIWTESDPAQLPEKNVPTASIVCSVRFHPVDSEIFASGHADSEARLHRLGQMHRLVGHTGEVRRVAWSPEGTRLATASGDGTTRIWDTVIGAEVLQLHGHPRGVRDVAWSRRGDRLSTVSDDGLHRVWKVGSEPDYRWFGTREPVRALAWNPIEGEITVGRAPGPDDGRTTSRWTLEVSRRTVKYVDYPKPTALAWTPDGRMLAVGTVGGGISLLAQNFRPLVQLDDEADGVSGLSWSADGSLLAVASRDRKLSLPRIFDTAGKQVTPLRWRRHSGFISAVAWHPHQQLVAFADDDNTITMNSMDRTLCTLRMNRRFTCMSWHPDGERLAVGSADATVCLLRLTGEIEEEAQLSGHRGQINAVAWSPDGTSLLTASDDWTARVWDPETGGQRTALIGHSAAVTAALWSPQGLAITGSADRTVRFWDTADGFTHPLSGKSMSGDLADLIAEARQRLP